MLDKIFKIGILIAAVLFLFLYYSASQKGRYQAITQYEGSLGILDSRNGVVYMLDIESDQWTLIKPFSPSSQVSPSAAADNSGRMPVVFPRVPKGM